MNLAQASNALDLIYVRASALLSASMRWAIDRKRTIRIRTIKALLCAAIFTGCPYAGEPYQAWGQKQHSHPAAVAQSVIAPQPKQTPASSQTAPSAPTGAMAHGDMYAPTIFTLRSGIAQGRMVYLGVGGEIDGKVNPTMMVHEGEIVQINLINGEGAEHDIVVDQTWSWDWAQAARCRSPPTRSANLSTSVR